MHWQECVRAHVCLCENLSHNFVQSSQVLMQYLRKGEMFTLLSSYTHTHTPWQNLISHVVPLICHSLNGLFTWWGIIPCDQCLLSHKRLHDADAAWRPLGWQMSFEQVNNEHSLSFTTDKRVEGQSRTSGHFRWLKGSKRSECFPAVQPLLMVLLTFPVAIDNGVTCKTTFRPDRTIKQALCLKQAGEKLLLKQVELITRSHWPSSGPGAAGAAGIWSLGDQRKKTRCVWLQVPDSGGHNLTLPWEEMRKRAGQGTQNKDLPQQKISFILECLLSSGTFMCVWGTFLAAIWSPKSQIRLVMAPG